MIKHRNIEVPKVGNYEIEEKELKEVEGEFEKVFDYKLPLRKRIGAFIRGENKAGRTVGIVLDGLSLVLPRLRTARNLARTVITRKKNPMLDKIKSLKNFINVRDENGNFSWQEALASGIQLSLAVGIFYGAKELGVIDYLMQFLGQ